MLRKQIHFWSHSVSFWIVANWKGENSRSYLEIIQTEFDWHCGWIKLNKVKKGYGQWSDNGAIHSEQLPLLFWF